MKLFRKVPKWARPTKADKVILNWFLALKPGDIAYDCDGFNCEVQSIQVKKIYLRGGQRVDYPTKRWYISLPGTGLSDIFFVNGGIACHPSPPLTVDQINQKWARFSEAYPNNPVAKLAKQGKPICDERGVILPELNGKQNVFVTE